MIPRSPLQTCRMLELCSPAQAAYRTMLKQNKLIFQRHVVHSVQMLEIINRNHTKAKIPLLILVILNWHCNSKIQVGTLDICALSSTQEPSEFFNTWFDGQKKHPNNKETHGIRITIESWKHFSLRPWFSLNHRISQNLYSQKSHPWD